MPGLKRERFEFRSKGLRPMVLVHAAFLGPAAAHML